MRKLKIVFLEEAIHDLEEIWFYTFKTWSQEQADRYHSLIIKEIDFLAKKPESGKKLDYLRKAYRSSKVKSHYIFFRFTSNELELYESCTRAWIFLIDLMISIVKRS